MHLNFALASLVAFVLMATGCTGTSASKEEAEIGLSQGDPVRGEQIHEVCFSCHGTKTYTSAQRKINSLPALRKEVARWGDHYNPVLSAQDEEDVAAYLNLHFYKF